MTQNISVLLKDATIGFRHTIIAENLNIEIEKGQWVAILGPNGSGKTTLVKSLLGSLPLRAGELHQKLAKSGYVPQKVSWNTDSPLTVAEFLDLCADNFEGAEKFRGEVTRALSLQDFIDQPMRRLSGGQIQKAFFALALWNSPEVLYLDEFLEGFDQKTVKSVIHFLNHLHQDHLFTVIEVSHDLSSVARQVDRVIIFDRGIKYDGSPKDHGFHSCAKETYGEDRWIKHD